MSPNRRISITAGALFLLATAASVTGSALAPPLTGANLLGDVASRSGAMSTAQLLSLVAAGCSVGIAVAMYAVLRISHPTISLAAVVFRGIEAVFYAVGAVALLTLVSLNTAIPSTAQEGPTPAQTVGHALVATHHRAGIAAVSAFVVGALMYNVALYRTRIVPRWLAGWGIAALPFMAVACMMALYADKAVTDYVALALPLGLQEIVFGVWLLVKGFSRARRDDVGIQPPPRTGAVLTP